MTSPPTNGRSFKSGEAFVDLVTEARAAFARQ
jgi:hypothetical protein